MRPSRILDKISQKFKTSLESRWSLRWGIMRHFWIRFYFVVILVLIIMVNVHMVVRNAFTGKTDDDQLNCERLKRLPIMGNIREQQGKNKKVYRAQFYKQQLVVKEASQSEWVIDQAKTEVKFANRLKALKQTPNVLLNCSLQKGVLYAMEAIQGWVFISNF